MQIRSTYIDTLEVFVGHSKEAFTVHEDIICASSSFFKVAASGGWKEALAKTTVLPDLRGWDFVIYLNWLYTGDVKLVTFIEAEIEAEINVFGAEEPCGEDRRFQIGYALCNLWLHGNFLGDWRFESEVMKCIVQEMNQETIGLKRPELDLIFNKAPRGSELYEFAIDILFPSVRTKESVEHIAETLPATVIQALLEKHVKRMGRKLKAEEA